jgi:uracil-DNA glycosylase
VPSREERDACDEWLQRELAIIRPKLLIPVGRLAIERFLPTMPLDRIIGCAFDVRHAGGASLMVPLPHPSGASSWIHQGDHPRLLARAIARIGRELVTLGIGAGPRARSVA